MRKSTSAILILIMMFFSFCESTNALPNVTTNKHMTMKEKCLFSSWNSMSNGVVVTISGFLRFDEDDKWRYYATMNITNNGDVSVTISQVRTIILNVTYVDEAFENWNVSGNITVNQVLYPESSLPLGWKITEFGFLKEPKIIWVTLEIFLLGLEDPLTSTFAIPEFLSFLILPLFMIATLLAVIIYKRKHSV